MTGASAGSLTTPIFAANWKMHHGPTAARDFVRRFVEVYPARTDRTVLLCPSAIAIDAVATALSSRPDILVGAQNLWTEPKGAFTGECSALMAREAGARVAVVGHSERRHVFGETNAQTALKCLRACEAGLIPMLCVGEKLEQREAGKTTAVVIEQLREGLSKLSADQLSTVVIAYEPVWAIGTGRTATPDDAATVHAAIRATLAEIGPSLLSTAILYGGSVNADNAVALLAAPGVDGLLVGGASLDPVVWAKICQS